MSNTQFAFIDRSRVPDRSALQASIDAMRFDLKLHPEYTPFDDSGFLPFLLNGEEGFGFEIYYQDASEIIGDDRSLGAIANGRDHCISMVWRGSLKDLACVMIVSCALTKDFDAVVSYEGEKPQPLDAMLTATHDVIKDGAGETPPISNGNQTDKPSVRRAPWWKFW
jgi:hypothetical protein